MSRLGSFHHCSLSVRGVWTRGGQEPGERLEGQAWASWREGKERRFEGRQGTAREWARGEGPQKERKAIRSQGNGSQAGQRGREIQGGGTRENWGTESRKEEGDTCWKSVPREGEKGFEKAAGRENGGDGRYDRGFPSGGEPVEKG